MTVNKEEKRFVSNGHVKFIKINREAVQEIITEFFFENQETLFKLNDCRFSSPELAVSFLDNGDITCYLYDRNEGVLDISDEALVNADYTATSLFSPNQAYRDVFVEQGHMSENNDTGDGTVC